MHGALLCLAFVTAPTPSGSASSPAEDSAPRPPTSLAPRAASWSEVRAAGLDPAWLLPEEPRDGDQPDLVAEAEALLARELAGDEREPLRTLGDLVQALGPLRAQPRERDRRLRAFLDARPDLADVRGPIEELLRDGAFRDDDWNPGDDRKDDGFWMGAAWDLRTERRAPWTELEGSHQAFQAATLIHADAATLLRTANELWRYEDHVGRDYERIEPRLHLRGEDPTGLPYAAVLTSFERDLPFPFGSSEYDLWTLYRIDARGRLFAHVTTRSPAFHWLAGHDVHLPVHTSTGTLVALLVVRRFGFDLDGIPDRDANRREALREGLGNFKRDAESLARERPSPLRPLEELPAFEVVPPR